MAGEATDGEMAAGEMIAGVAMAGEMTGGMGGEIGLDVDLAALNTAIDQVMNGFLSANSDLEGAAVIALHRDLGVLHREAYGAFDEDRVYFVASSSKMVAAGMINRLHDDGVMNMYASIGDVVDWGQSRPAIQPVHLISNTSGLPGLQSLTAARGHLCQFLPGGSLQECARTIFEAEPAVGERIVPPDTEFRYGGGQWQVAGGLAEIASGKSWGQLFDEIYAAPCGLTSSGFSHQSHFAPMDLDLIYPSDFDADLNNLRPTDNPWVEGGMYTTIDDYGKLLMMHLQGGKCGSNQVHSRETISRMHADRILDVFMGHTGNPSLGGYAMGWWVDRNRDGVIHDPGAYGSWAYIDKSRNLAVLSVMEADILPEGFSLFSSLKPAIERAVDELITD